MAAFLDNSDVVRVSTADTGLLKIFTWVRKLVKDSLVDRVRHVQ